mgnify:CR=1 FL=1|jgi:hypothetical protein
MLNQCPISAQSVPNQCPIGAHSVPTQCPISAQSVPNQCPISAQSVPNQCQISAKSVPNQCVGDGRLGALPASLSMLHPRCTQAKDAAEMATKLTYHVHGAATNDGGCRQLRVAALRGLQAVRATLGCSKRDRQGSLRLSRDEVCAVCAPCVRTVCAFAVCACGVRVRCACRVCVPCARAVCAQCVRSVCARRGHIHPRPLCHMT